MAEAKNGIHAALGTGSFVVDRAKKFGERIQGYASDYRKWVTSNYRDLVKRGERITTSVKRSAPVKRAQEQTKTAQSQVKGAVTSVRKALGANVEAVQSAAKKVS
jgi:hypothetical protein